MNSEETKTQIEEFEGWFDCVHVGMGLINPELRYIRVNRKMAEINDLSPENHVGKSIAEVLPDLKDEIEPFVIKALNGEPTVDVEVITVAPSDPETKRSWSVSYFPVRNHSGRIFAASSVLLETTHNWKLREEVLASIGDERDRIGREIHATISQEIGGIALLAQSLLEKLDAEQHPCAKQASFIVDNLRKVGKGARNVAHSLSPLTIEGIKLSEALGMLAETITTLHPGVNCRTEIGTGADDLSPALASELYFVASEAAFNAARHGSPEDIIITISDSIESLMVSVEDNGGGNLDAINEVNGLGLRSMQARAWNLGGHFEIQENESKNGVVVGIQIPKPDEN